jgi:hypothetical protein
MGFYAHNLSQWLANVARPRVGLQQLQALLFYASYFLPSFTGVAIDEVLDHYGNVFSSFRPLQSARFGTQVIRRSNLAQ